MFCCDQAEEAQDQYQSCMADAGVRKMDLANAKSTALTQIREMVFQCDLTLKAVSGHYMIRSRLTSRVTEREVDYPITFSCYIHILQAQCIIH